MERRRGLYKNYLSSRSYEIKRKVKKMEKALKYELRRLQVEAMDKIAEDLEDAARRHNNKILYWHVNKLSRVVNPDFSQLKIGTGLQLEIRKVKERWVELFENLLNRYTVAGC